VPRARHDERAPDAPPAEERRRIQGVFSCRERAALSRDSFARHPEPSELVGQGVGFDGSLPRAAAARDDERSAAPLAEDPSGMTSPSRRGAEQAVGAAPDDAAENDDRLLHDREAYFTGAATAGVSMRKTGSFGEGAFWPNTG
jgi:hypothetical protein